MNKKNNLKKTLNSYWYRYIKKIYKKRYIKKSQLKNSIKMNDMVLNDIMNISFKLHTSQVLSHM